MKKFTPPGSKSYTNRALIIASLAKGTSILSNVLHSDDTTYMMKALQEIGVQITLNEDNKVTITNKTNFHTPKKALFIGNSGTSIRFLTSLLTFVTGTTIITGDDHMQQRPIQPLIDALLQTGIDIKSVNNTGCPPIEVTGTGAFPGGAITVTGNISSQYLSSILMLAPLADKQTTITVEGNLVSKPYIDITLTIMKKFGVEVVNNDYQQFILPSHQQYTARSYTIEPDASAASYFFAAASLLGEHLTIDGLGTTSKQGDLQFVNVLESCGVKIQREATNTSVVGGGIDAKERVFDMHHFSDTVPTMAVLAATIPATTTITNVANIRVKETDRIKALVTELTKLGVGVKEFDDGLSITGLPVEQLKKNVSIATYDDHRMAMSFAVLQKVLPSLVIENPQCVAKTYPHFWEDFTVVFG